MYAIRSYYVALTWLAVLLLAVLLYRVARAEGDARPPEALVAEDLV